MTDNEQVEREALKPCPFCGAKAYIEQGKSEPCQLHGERSITYRVVAMHTNPKFSNESNAKRKDCHIRPAVTSYSREDAIKAWNTRANLESKTDSHVQALVEALSDLIPLHTAPQMFNGWFQEEKDRRFSIAMKVLIPFQQPEAHKEV